eukprot:885195-Pyramimonas_sp.AAC.2
MKLTQRIRPETSTGASCVLHPPAREADLGWALWLFGGCWQAYIPGPSGPIPRHLLEDLVSIYSLRMQVRRYSLMPFRLVREPPFLSCGCLFVAGRFCNFETLIEA